MRKLRVLFKRAETMNMLFILTILSTAFVVQMVTSDDTVDSMEPDYPMSFANHNEWQSTRNGSEYQIYSNEVIVSLKDNPSENAMDEEILMFLVQIVGMMNGTEFAFIAQDGAKYKFRDICDMVKFVFLGMVIPSMVMVTRFKRATNDKCIESDGSMSRTRIMWHGFISSITAAMTRYFSIGIDR